MAQTSGPFSQSRPGGRADGVLTGLGSNVSIVGSSLKWKRRIGKYGATLRTYVNLSSMTSQPRLRIATPADAAEIAEVTRQAYSKWIAVAGREPLPMKVDYMEAVRRDRFDLLHLDGRLAALIQTRPESDRLLIVNVAVAPHAQGRGLGTRLLHHADQLAIQLGLAGTRLYTNKMFLENVGLYLSLGYAVEREEQLNGGVAVHMVKPPPDA